MDKLLESFKKLTPFLTSEKEKEKYGWEFLFLGANIDAVSVAGRFGISADRAIDYECDQAGTLLNYEMISETVSAVRKCRSKAEIDRAFAECAAPVRADYAKRHKGKNRC